MLVKVEGGDFAKDTKNKAILAINPAALQQNEARKKLSEKINGKNEEINKLKDKVENLSLDISEIKSMLKQLIK